jgi:hypothetical protein
MTVALGDDAERVERRAEGIINLAFETNLGAAVGGGIGIAVGLLVPVLARRGPAGRDARPHCARRRSRQSPPRPARSRLRLIRPSAGGLADAERGVQQVGRV